MRSIAIISILIIFASSFLSQPISLSAQETSQLPKAPSTIEEAKHLAIQVLEAFPSAIKMVWQDQALPLWQKTWVKWWNLSIKPWIQTSWYKTQILFGKEVKKRQPAIKKEFKKENEEMEKEIKKQIPGFEKTLWERFREIIK